MNEQDVATVLRQAVAAVEASGVEPGLRSAAFERAIDLLTRDRSETPLDAPSGRADRAPAADGSPSDPLSLIAIKLGLEREVVEEVFAVEGSDLTLTVSRGRLDARKAAGTKQIALLLAAARQSAAFEEWTEGALVRQVADDYGKYDGSNFAATLGEMGDFFAMTGSGQRAKLKVRRAGFDAARELIASLGA
jgi:hypothetical protein